MKAAALHLTHRCIRIVPLSAVSSSLTESFDSSLTSYSNFVGQNLDGELKGCLQAKSISELESILNRKDNYFEKYRFYIPLAFAGSTNKPFFRLLKHFAEKRDWKISAYSQESSEAWSYIKKIKQIHHRDLKNESAVWIHLNERLQAVFSINFETFQFQILGTNADEGLYLFWIEV